VELQRLEYSEIQFNHGLDLEQLDFRKHNLSGWYYR